MIKMRVEVTHEAEQYIKGNGCSVMVLLGTMTGCCGGTAPMPQIHIGSPQDLSGYEKNVMGDITVFVDKRINAEKIDILISKLLWFRKLSVDIV